jgi:hypothetical protein
MSQSDQQVKTSDSVAVATQKPFRWYQSIASLVGLLVVWCFNGFLAFEIAVFVIPFWHAAACIRRLCTETRPTILSRLFQYLGDLTSILIVFFLFVLIYFMCTPALSSVARATTETAIGRQFRNICIGIHYYHEKYNQFPSPAIVSSDGKPLLSWRVAILPFIDQQHLFNQFKLNEPWNSQHNLTLLEKMPSIFAMPKLGRQAAPGYTYFQLFVGPGAILEHGAIRTIPQVQKADGLSETLLGAIAHESVPWTKPG